MNEKFQERMKTPQLVSEFLMEEIIEISKKNDIRYKKLMTLSKLNDEREKADKKNEKSS